LCHLFLVASGRSGGNTERLAREAAASLPDDAAQTWLHLADLPLPPFEDLRHAPGGYPAELHPNARALLDATMEATDLVFVSPIYWYGLPASAQLYLDHWTHWFRREELGFKESLRSKTFWLVTVQTAEDIAHAEPFLTSVRLVARYCGARWGGSVIGYGSAPGDILKGAAALDDARRLFAQGGDLQSSFATVRRPH